MLTAVTRRGVSVALVLGLVALVATSAPVAAGGEGGDHPPDRPRGRAETSILFNGEGNNLNAYGTRSPFPKQNVIRNADDDPNGLDINAQICFFPDGSRRFIAGEDTGQPNPPAGWGIFELEGNRIGELDARKVAKLTPT